MVFNKILAIMILSIPGLCLGNGKDQPIATQASVSSEVDSLDNDVKQLYAEAKGKLERLYLKASKINIELKSHAAFQGEYPDQSVQDKLQEVSKTLGLIDRMVNLVSGEVRGGVKPLRIHTGL